MRKSVFSHFGHSRTIVERARAVRMKEPEDVAAARDPASVLEAVDQMLLLQRLESLPTTWGQQYQIMGMQLCLKQSNGEKPQITRGLPPRRPALALVWKWQCTSS